jgi:hypothetical protein
MNIDQERYEYIENKLAEELYKFRESMKLIADEAMGNVYADVLPHIASDTEFNITNRVEGVVKNLIEGNFEDISTETLKPYFRVSDSYGMYVHIHMSEYSKICENIYHQFKDDIQNNLINKLEAEVKSLKEQLNSAYKRY